MTNIRMKSWKKDILSVANRSLSVITTDRKQNVISFIETNGKAVVSDIAGVVNLIDGRVKALLREIVADDTIEKIGDKRYTHYILKN